MFCASLRSVATHLLPPVLAALAVWLASRPPPSVAPLALRIMRRPGCSSGPSGPHSLVLALCLLPSRWVALFPAFSSYTGLRSRRLVARCSALLASVPLVALCRAPLSCSFPLFPATSSFAGVCRASFSVLPAVLPFSYRLWAGCGLFLSPNSPSLFLAAVLRLIRPRLFSWWWLPLFSPFYVPSHYSPPALAPGSSAWCLFAHG